MGNSFPCDKVRSRDGGYAIHDFILFCTTPLCEGLNVFLFSFFRIYFWTWVFYFHVFIGSVIEILGWREREKGEEKEEERKEEKEKGARVNIAYSFHISSTNTVEPR